MTGIAPARDILLKAADLLSERGWCQNAFEQPNGSLCSVGALMSADQELNGFDGWSARFAKDCYGVACDALVEEIGNASIVYWNDAQGRSAEDVILAFKHAADRVD